MGRSGGVRGYRHGGSGRIGTVGAGTFFFLDKNVARGDAQVARFKFGPGELLTVRTSSIANPGFPSETLAHRWFPNRDWEKAARKLGLGDDQDGPQIAMDIHVAREAKRRGYQAIKYGKYELQVLDWVRY